MAFKKKNLHGSLAENEATSYGHPHDGNTYGEDIRNSDMHGSKEKQAPNIRSGTHCKSSDQVNGTNDRGNRDGANGKGNAMSWANIVNPGSQCNQQQLEYIPLHI